MKIFKHYGIDVIVQVTNKDQRFTDFLESEGIRWFDIEEIPHHGGTVIGYIKEEKIKYAVCISSCNMDYYYDDVYITDKIPVDGRWSTLVSDVTDQERGGKPYEIENVLNCLTDHRSFEEALFGDK